MSTLVDHYLLHLKSLLPAKQRDDIAAELRESIRSAVEEREREQGRALTDAELNERAPRLRASDGRRRALLADAAPDRPRRVSAVLVRAAGRADRHHGRRRPPGRDRAADRAERRAGALQVAVDFWWFALQAAALVTLVFAALDHGKARFSFLEKFDARKVSAGIWGVRGRAAVGDPARRHRVRDCDDGVLLLWWVEWLAFPSEWLGVVLR